MNVFTIPTYRNWRIHSYPANNIAILVPNRIGTKFTTEELDSLLSWLKDNGLTALKQSTTSVRVMSDDIEFLILEDYGIAGVEMDKAILEEEHRLQEKEKKEKTDLKEYDSLPSSKWIKTTFPEDCMNQYNRHRLAEFLDGKVKTFQGQYGWKWAETILELQALSPDNQSIDFDKLKEAYLDANRAFH